MAESGSLVKFTGVLFFGGAVALLGAYELYRSSSRQKNADVAATKNLVEKLHGVSPIEKARFKAEGASEVIENEPDERRARKENYSATLQYYFNKLLPKEEQ